MSRTMGIIGALALSVATFGPGLEAQERTIEEVDLPANVAEEIIAFFNDPGTLRFNGRSSVPADRLVQGDVGVLGGPFLVAGEIVGGLVVVNGDVQFTETGRVDGDLIVVGGEVIDATSASVSGTTIVYDEVLRYDERRDRLEIRRTRRGRDDDRFVFGRSRFLVRTAGNYNRVEGLPVFFGPVFETRGRRTGTRIEALGLWRTESGFKLDGDELGYRFSLEQRFGEQPRFALGGGLSSTIRPISELGVSSVESSLSTFFFHEDHRDYYEQEGWYAYGELRLDQVPVRLRAEYRDEDHRFAAVSSPWTIRKNDDPWRPQPLVAEGDLQSVVGELTVDDRNDPDRPSHGWYLQARLTKGVDGSLFLPQVTTLPGTGPGTIVDPVPVDETFAAGFVDLRRYNRVSPDAELNFRAVYGGSLDGDPVPPQYQLALGGEGSLPGYHLFSVDCGARSTEYEIRAESYDQNGPAVQRVFGSYGCDRAALFQVEYRGHLAFDFALGPDDDDDWTSEWAWYPLVDLDPTWVAFFNVGRGWSESDPSLDTGTFSDLGLGLFLGDLGLYWAFPLEGEDRGVNFFIRWQRRF